MRGLFALLSVFVFSSATVAHASYLGLGEEVRQEVRKGEEVKLEVGQGGEIKLKERKGGVVFPVINKTNRNINQIFGWVYGYEGKQPEKFILVSNPNAPAKRISPGPHLPGKTALYWFQVPAYHLKMKQFGVVVYDASVFFDR
jgi:hypothetical protein